MLMTKERLPSIRHCADGPFRSCRKPAPSECEEHGWMQDRAEPHARDRALDIARQEPPPGVSPQAAAVAVAELLDSIGDTCPECPSD
jgi:hypothetical protein